MNVTYTIELKVVLEDDDDAEEFRHHVENTIRRDWATSSGESATVKTKSIG